MRMYTFTEDQLMGLLTDLQKNFGLNSDLTVKEGKADIELTRDGHGVQIEGIARDDDAIIAVYGKRTKDYKIEATIQLHGETVDLAAMLLTLSDEISESHQKIAMTMMLLRAGMDIGSPQEKDCDQCENREFCEEMEAQLGDKTESKRHCH